MKWLLSLAAGVYVSSDALRASGTAKDTPVTTVVELMERLAAQIQKEGAQEAAEYDKYACFCKEQSDEKQYNIERSEEKIETLTATIDKLDGEITVLNQEVIDLGKRIDAIDTEVKTETDARDTEREKFEEDDKDMANAIESCRGAMKALRESKNKIATDGGKVDGGDLLQLPEGARRALVALMGLSVVESSAKPENLHDLLALVQAVQNPGKSATYQYHSNDILDLLAKLLVDFKKNKKELWDTEYAARTAFDSKMVDLKNEKQFKSESKARKEALSAKKDVEKTEAEKDRTLETADKDSDEAFKAELTTQCQQKAEDWDQRSSFRANEITMLNEAVEKLKTAVNPKYDVNKKLVNLAKVASHVTKQARTVSFLQRGQKNSDAEAKAAIVHKALQFLNEKAGALKSSLLLGLAAKVSLQDDHFVKVRSLIGDLIARLEADAIAEADHKTYCDGKMKTAVGDRDKEQLNFETHEATRSEKESEKKELEGEIADLSKEISELTKALTEATELRANEKEINDKAIKDATDGKKAIGEAIKLLKDFYAFVQYKPPKSDRNDKTVGDLAPETSWDGEYKGKLDASKGIIGLLEVIEADFDRTLTKITQDESDAQDKFDTFKTDTDTSIATKDKDKKAKEDKVGITEDEIVTAMEDSKDAKDLHEKSLEELEKLQAMCVEGEETRDERFKNRENEIEALKEALQILDDYKTRDDPLQLRTGISS